MKKADLQPRLSGPGSLERELPTGEAPLLTVTARWPRLEEECPGLRRINRYYEHMARQWLERWEGPLLSQARAGHTEGAPPWRASLTYEITLLTPELLSLWWEAAEDTGARRPRFFRQGDIWSLPQGTPVLPGTLFAPLGRHWRKAVREEVEAQIQGRLKTGECLFREDWPQKIRARLAPEQFYLTAEGPMLFYPVEAIAPALEGFPTFSLASLLPAEGGQVTRPQPE